MSLQRFYEAQADRSGGYDVALAEIRLGRKSSHWIWYIFPQLADLGHSSTARYYAIRDLDEAREFLRDPVLRSRFHETAAAVHDQLTRGKSLKTLMSSNLDAMKLISSVTLFGAAAGSITNKCSSFDELRNLCQAILIAAEAQGYSPCAVTLRQVDSQSRGSGR